MSESTSELNVAEPSWSIGLHGGIFGDRGSVGRLKDSCFKRGLGFGILNRGMNPPPDALSSTTSNGMCFFVARSGRVCARFYNGYTESGEKNVSSAYFLGMGGETCRFVPCRLQNLLAASALISGCKHVLLLHIKGYLRHRSDRFHEFHRSAWTLKDTETLECVENDAQGRPCAVLRYPDGFRRHLPFPEMGDRMRPELFVMQ
jgi:hypothetical protein